MIIAFFVFLLGTALGGLMIAWGDTGSLSDFGKRVAACRNCTLPIKGHHMIPIFGWLASRGKCKSCRIAIPFYYLLFEAMIGFAFLFVWLQYFGISSPINVGAVTWLEFSRHLVFALALILLFLFDFFHKEIPNRFTAPFVVMAFLLNLAFLHDPMDLILGGALLGGFFFVKYVLSRRQWVRMGDVKFGILLGVMLGVQGGIAAVILAYAIGASFAIVMLLSGIAERKRALPFGLFMAIAGYIMLFVSQNIFGM